MSFPTFFFYVYWLPHFERSKSAEYLLVLLQEVVSQGKLLVGLPVFLVPLLHGLDSRSPQLLRHLLGRGKRLLVVYAHRELQELLEVGDQQRPEVVGPGEQLLQHLEGGEAHLGVLLLQPRQQQVERVPQVLLRRPAQKGGGGTQKEAQHGKTDIWRRHLF